VRGLLARLGARLVNWGLGLDRLVGAACVAYALFAAYVANLALLGQSIPPLTWLWLWAVSLALMVGLGASRFVHEENPWGLVLAGFIGGTGTVGALMAGVPVLRSVAGFALSCAYWLGLRRHIGYPFINVEEATKRAIALNTALLLMNVIAYILLPT